MYFGLVIVFLTALRMNLNTVSAIPMDLDLVFNPNEDYVDSYEMLDSCFSDKKSYCFEKGENYPDKKIAELLKDFHEFKVNAPEPPVSIGSRDGGYLKDEPDCPSESTNKPIYYIIDENNQVRVVVQSPEKFQQIYTVNWCSNEGPITKDTPHFQKSTTLQKFNIECVSTKMNFEFFVLSEDQLKMEIVRARGGIPVCCRCRYKFGHTARPRGGRYPYFIYGALHTYATTTRDDRVSKAGRTRLVVE